MGCPEVIQTLLRTGVHTVAVLTENESANQIMSDDMDQSDLLVGGVSATKQAEFRIHIYTERVRSAWAG